VNPISDRVAKATAAIVTRRAVKQAHAPSGPYPTVRYGLDGGIRGRLGLLGDEQPDEGRTKLGIDRVRRREGQDRSGGNSRRACQMTNAATVATEVRMFGRRGIVAGMRVSRRRMRVGVMVLVSLQAGGCALLIGRMSTKRHSHPSDTLKGQPQDQ
jgi:hypothetical protein